MLYLLFKLDSYLNQEFFRKLTLKEFFSGVAIADDQPLPVLLKKRNRKNNKQGRIKRRVTFGFISDLAMFMRLVLV